ncbi:recombinase family protein [Bengtsoniella intestinalis]|uniref:recombinase family protein n=1 Tax=Bengtsoniella intestinalis TaxID=3073143 RepID=UPI00391F3B82
MNVAIYCRLSEEDRNKANPLDDSVSIQNQKTMLIQYASAQRWDIYHIYSDDDYTGADRNRPAFQALLADAQDGKFQIVLCKSQSRFTRELELVERYIHGLFPVLGIRFIGLVDNADTANKGNKKSRQINGLVNEWYLEDMSDNIRSVLTNRRQQGHHIGAFALYGYQKDPDQKGHLIIDPPAAAVVQEVFTLYSQGYGKSAIARILNDRNIPNPTEYKRQQHLRYTPPKSQTATLWKYPAISSMLVNAMYIGHMVQGRYGSVSYKTKENRPRPKKDWIVVENTHAPIIQPPLWDSVQNLIAQKTKPFVTGHIGLFAHKAQCATCGYTLRSSKCRGKHYLSCPTHHVKESGCIGAFIAVDTLEAMVLAQLNYLAEAYLDQTQLEQGIHMVSGLADRKQQLIKEKTLLEKKQDSHYLQTLYADKVDGKLSQEDFQQLRTMFNQEKESRIQTIATYQAKLEALQAQLDAGQNRRALVEQYLHIDKLTREMVEVLIDHITVGRRKQGEKYPPVEIHWNF